ncbi:MAG: type II toxin-antitoxin system HicA family toxin [Saprospiraceae bacterium]
MSSKELINLLKDNGWYEVRQKGSHKVFKHDEKRMLITVPEHGKRDIAKGTLNAILKEAGLK